MKRVSQLHALASLAKERMKSGNYNSITARPKDSFASALPASTYFMCNARALRKEYSKATIVSITNNDDELRDKVISLLRHHDMLFNPIGALTDKDKFNHMSATEQQQYIFTLSDKFNKIKDDYYSSINIA